MDDYCLDELMLVLDAYSDTHRVHDGQAAESVSAEDF